VSDLRVSSRRAQIDTLFGVGQRLETDPRSDIELKAHFSQYLCVLVAGFAERAVIDLYGEHIKRRSAKTVIAYGTSRLAGFQNPNSERLLQLAGAFDPQWRRDLELYIVGERKDALDSVMNNRHQIAHGTSVPITHGRLRRYYDKVVEIIEYIEAQVA
jgi:hypothetical protein